MSLSKSKRETIWKIDALTLGLNVLQALVSMRGQEKSELQFESCGVALRIVANLKTQRVEIWEVLSA